MGTERDLRSNQGEACLKVLFLAGYLPSDNRNNH